MSDDASPVDAVRIGPGQFLLAAERVTLGQVFIADGDRFEVVAKPVNIGGDRYMATIRLDSGQAAGRTLTAQLSVGHRVS